MVAAHAQSTLNPAGAEAEAVVTLFRVLLGGGTLIWLAVIALLFHALRSRRSSLSEAGAGRLILWCGALLPACILILLLGFALWLMPSLRPFPAEADAAYRIEVTGKQYWWRVVYHWPGQPPVVSANEIRLPVGRRVEFTLLSDDVIHAFWIPSLGGKMDMIPGRANRLSLHATKPGVFRGACTEYCGTSHALMAFTAVAMESRSLDEWLAARETPSAGAGVEGGGLFIRHGCGACHTVAGTGASGTLGPDLSHVGSRQTIAAGILPNTIDNLASFIADPQRAKPGSQMPGFSMLPPGDLRAIAAWLKGLE